jgi:hypothetical protein
MKKSMACEKGNVDAVQLGRTGLVGVRIASWLQLRPSPRVVFSSTLGFAKYIGFRHKFFKIQDDVDIYLYIGRILYQVGAGREAYRKYVSCPLCHLSI